jgi:hypothetical protein
MMALLRKQRWWAIEIQTPTTGATWFTAGNIKAVTAFSAIRKGVKEFSYLGHMSALRAKINKELEKWE